MVNKLIFRNDDVNKNSDTLELELIYHLLKEYEPSCEIWNGVTILSRYSKSGAVYPSLPLKNRPIEFFYDVDQMIAYPNFEYARTVSHGLWHIDHSKVSYELQEASILTSCKLLHTNIFVPPFNNYNDNTELICDRYGITLVKYDEGWKSFEHNAFDPTHKLWYFHSWKWNAAKLKEYLSHGYKQHS